jgi:hypothetical protein
MDLFIAAYPEAKWDKILALKDQDTAKAKTFRALLPGGRVPGERLVSLGCGYDYRTRVSRLRDLGIPVKCDDSKEESSCGVFYIDQAFLLAYGQQERAKRRSA